MKRPPAATLSLPRSPKGARLAAARAFTLVELILVIVLISILASVVVPRLTGNDGRRAENEVRAIESLLAAAATRDAFTAEPRILAWDAPSGTLAMFVRRVATGSVDSEPAWLEDGLVPPVRLALTEIREATADGQRLDTGSFAVQFSQTEPRPSLALLIAPRRQGARDAAGDSWQIDLAPEAIEPIRTPVASSAPRLSASPSRTVDLDATGQGGKPW
ncbi:MAG: type II secretion system protein [Phycisphaeraceae bacterium]|nr:type II secretion system protein [Phycisphaeraceae bacterium]